MSSVWVFLVGLVLLVLWIYIGGLVTQANVYLTSYRKTDTNFAAAYRDTFKAAFITWTIVGIFLLLAALSVAGVVALFGSGVGEVAVAGEGGAIAAEGSAVAAEGAGEASLQDQLLRAQHTPNLLAGVSWVTIIFLVCAIVLVLVTGYYALRAANSLASSSNYNNGNHKQVTAYDDCRRSAVLSLGTVGAMLLVVIVYYGYEYAAKRHAETEIKTAATQRAVS